ncbi:MAG: guanylate kinase [Thermoanaerobaculia bacterium]
MTSAPPRRGDLFVISAPSGAGKETLVRRVLESGLLPDPGRVVMSVSHTTRRPRVGERDGVDYHFVDEATFEAMIAADELLEWARYQDRSYGTSRAEVEPRLAAGVDVVLVIEVQGAERIMREHPEVHSIFILPPSYEELERRLAARGLDGPDAIRGRLAVSLGEIRRYKNYDYVMINDDLDRAGLELASIFLEKRLRTEHMEERVQQILASFEAALGAD